MRRVFYSLCALLFVVVSTAFSVVDHPTITSDEVTQSDSCSLSRRHHEAVKSLTVWRDTVRAERLWREIIAEEGDYAPALYNLSKLNTVSYYESLRLAERAYNADTTNKWYCDNYAMLLFGCDDLDKALAMFKHLLTLDSHQPSTYYYISYIYGEKNQPYSAIAILDSAEMRIGRNAYLDKVRLQMLIQTHQFDQAISVGRRVVEDNPYDVEARLQLAATYERTHRDSLARAAYEEAYLVDTMRLESIVELLDYHLRNNNVAEQFRFEEKILTSERIPINVKVERVESFMDGDFYRDNFFRVGGLISALVKHYPTDRDVVRLNTLHLCHAGMLPEAQEYMRSHTYDEDTTPDDFSLLVAIDTALEDEESLYSDIEHGLELFPDEVSLISMYATIHYYSDDAKGAIRILSNATKRLKSSEDLSLCWGRIGDLYHELENDNKAFKAYRKALDYNPDNVEVLNNYAYYLSLRDEELEKALSMSLLATTLESDNYNYIDTYAWVLHRLGRNAEAKKFMRHALMLSQHGEASLLAHYGDILWALGEKFMAETYWQKAVDAGYDVDEMKEHIAQLKQNK